MSSIKVGGLSVHYNALRGLPTSEQRDSASLSKVLLLVHGAGGSSRHWEPMLPSIESSFFPIALDLPGHGATDGYVPDSISAVAAFLKAFLIELGISGPICYVGQSMGGLIGLQFTLDYPDLVDRLVLMATAARIQLHPDFLEQAVSGQWNMTLLRESFGSEIPEDVKELVLSTFQHTRTPADASDFMGVSAIDLSDAITSVQVPTLILTGEDDVIISPRKSTLLQRQISGSRLVRVPGAGHYLHVEKPSIVAAEVMHFLEGEDNLVSALPQSA